MAACLRVSTAASRGQAPHGNASVRVQLPNGPFSVLEDSDTAMQAPEWTGFLSIVDGSLNPVPRCYLDQVLLKEITKNDPLSTLQPHLQGVNATMINSGPPL